MIEPCSSVVPPVAQAAQGATDQPKPLILYIDSHTVIAELEAQVLYHRQMGTPVLVCGHDTPKEAIEQAVADLLVEERPPLSIEWIELRNTPAIDYTPFARQSAYDRRNPNQPFYRNIKRRKKR